MKIAFYISDMDKGGAQRVVVNLMKDFLRRGDEVLLITTRKGKREYELPEGIQRVYTEVPDKRLGREDLLGRIGNFFLRIHLIRKALKKGKPDSTVSFMGKTNLMLLLASRFLPGKFFVSVRATPSEEYNTKLLAFMAQTCFCMADGVILQTEPSISYFNKRIQKKVSVLPNPLNTQFLRPVYEGEREKEIVAVGRIDENKNHRMIVEAYKRMLSMHPELKEYRLVIYGDGELRSTLIKENEGLKEGSISFPGLITDVPAAIEKASLYILSSDTEGMPNSLMEAMALGLPVISTDCPCGGPATLIKDGENGRLVPVRDTERLSEVMALVLSSEDAGKAMGLKASEIQKTCDPAVVTAMWREVLCAE